MIKTSVTVVRPELPSPLLTANNLAHGQHRKLHTEVTLLVAIKVGLMGSEFVLGKTIPFPSKRNGDLLMVTKRGTEHSDRLIPQTL